MSALRYHVQSFLCEKTLLIDHTVFQFSPSSLILLSCRIYTMFRAQYLGGVSPSVLNVAIIYSRVQAHSAKHSSASGDTIYQIWSQLVTGG